MYPKHVILATESIDWGVGLVPLTDILGAEYQAATPSEQR